MPGVFNSYRKNRRVLDGNDLEPVPDLGTASDPVKVVGNTWELNQ